MFRTFQKKIWSWTRFYCCCSCCCWFYWGNFNLIGHSLPVSIWVFIFKRRITKITKFFSFVFSEFVPRENPASFRHKFRMVQSLENGDDFLNVLSFKISKKAFHNQNQISNINDFTNLLIESDKCPTCIFITF